MSYESLKHFITQDMLLSHVYQPVMLKTILENGGKASAETIAAKILAKDPTQLEYYVDRVKNMVGSVLTKERGITVREGQEYSLPDFHQFTHEQVQELVALCDQRLHEYERRREAREDHVRSLVVLPVTVRATPAE